MTRRRRTLIGAKGVVAVAFWAAGVVDVGAEPIKGSPVSDPAFKFLERRNISSSRRLAEGEEVKEEIVVTVWNLLSHQLDKNPYEFVGPRDETSETLRRHTAGFRQNAHSVSEFIGEDRVTKLTDPNSWDPAIKNVVDWTLESGKSEAEAVQEEWDEIGATEVKLFLQNHLGDEDGKVKDVEVEVPIRKGFNDFFLCEGSIAQNSETPEKFKLIDVFSLLVYDMLLDTAKAAAENDLGAEQVMADHAHTCETIFPEKNGEKNRMKRFKKVIQTFKSDVVVLLEAEKNWLGGNDGLGRKITDELPGFDLRYSRPDAKDEAPLDKLKNSHNAIILFRKSKFDRIDLVTVGDTQQFSIKVWPKGFEPESLNILAFHFPSGRTESRRKVRSQRFAKLMDPVSYPGGELTSFIAAGNCNGDPRAPGDYLNGVLGYEDSLVERSSELFRATHAPWGHDDYDKPPKTGTCNKEKTFMQPDIVKALVPDLHLKDNIYAFSAPDGIKIKQLDLCDPDPDAQDDRCDSHDTGADYTMGGDLHCYSSKEADNSIIGPQGASRFPTTCGYVEGRMFLPRLDVDFGISDHSPVTARFELTMREPAPAEPSCLAPENVANGATCAEGAVIKAGETCTIVCDDGYKATNGGISECDPAVETLVPTIHCEVAAESAKDCTTTKVENAVTCSGVVIKHGESCAPTCAAGYELRLEGNAAPLTCNNGKLTPITFLCQAVVTPPSPPVKPATLPEEEGVIETMTFTTVRYADLHANAKLETAFVASIRTNVARELQVSESLVTVVLAAAPARRRLEVGNRRLGAAGVQAKVHIQAKAEDRVRFKTVLKTASTKDHIMKAVQSVDNLQTVVTGDISTLPDAVVISDPVDQTKDETEPPPAPPPAPTTDQETPPGGLGTMGMVMLLVLIGGIGYGAFTMFRPPPPAPRQYRAASDDMNEFPRFSTAGESGVELNAPMHR